VTGGCKYIDNFHAERRTALATMTLLTIFADI